MAEKKPAGDLIVQPAPKQKGGARPGSGRKPGSSNAKKYSTVLEVLNSDVMQGLLPITVMLHNMKFYHDRAESLSDQLLVLAEQIKPADIKPGNEKIMATLKLIAEVGDFRTKAQGCAVDAAKYVHPALSAMAVKVTSGDSRKPPPQITENMPARQAEEVYQSMLQDE